MGIQKSCFGFHGWLSGECSSNSSEPKLSTLDTRHLNTKAYRGVPKQGAPENISMPIELICNPIYPYRSLIEAHELKGSLRGPKHKPQPLHKVYVSECISQNDGANFGV